MGNQKYPSVSAWSVEDTSVYTEHSPNKGYTLSIASHPSENKFATWGTEGIRIWQGLVQAGDFREIQNWKRDSPYDSAHAMTFSPDGRWLCSGGTDAQVKFWDVASETVIKTFDKQDRQIRSLAFSHDSQTLVSGSDQRIKIWDANSGEVKHSFFAHPDWIRGLAITANNQFLLSAGDTRIKTWNLETGEQLGAMEADASIIRSMVLSQDGTTLVTGHRRGAVKVWKLEL